MGLIKRWLGGGEQSRAGPEARGMDAALWALLDGPRSAAGVSVGEESALRNTAVLACVRILSETTAMLPLPVFKRTGARGKERAPEHPLYPVLQEQANPEMTAFELRRWLMQQRLLYGDGFAEVEWTPLGEVRALWPLLSGQMEVERRNGALVYVYTLPNGKKIELAAWRVLHLRGMTGNGVRGYSVIRSLMMEAVGLGLATQEYGARFFGNGARPGIVLTHPGTLSAKALGNMRASWADAHEGLSQSHRMRILEEGMDVKTITIPPEEAQFLETRRFQVTEIARAFGVPPHLIGDLERATFSNIEHQGMEFLQFSLGPHLKHIEQTIHAQLMRPVERQVYFVEHVRDALLQADTTTRYQAYALGRQWGWLSVNDIRGLENMNPVEDGDEYLVPLNMVPAGEEPAGREEPEEQPARAWWGPLAEDVARRAARRHCADWRRAGARTGDEEWRGEYFGEYEAAVTTMVAPLLRAAGKAAAAAAAGRAVAQAAQAGPEDEAGLAGAIYLRLMEVLDGA